MGSPRGKTSYEVVVHLNENATKTMQDKMILIKKSLTSSHRLGWLNL
ncbi:transposon-encoded TnpW family protein [Treponema denticola]|nr:hypothetical protein E4N77_03070 [Treponema denticola]